MAESLKCKKLDLVVVTLPRKDVEVVEEEEDLTPVRGQGQETDITLGVQEAGQDHGYAQEDQDRDLTEDPQGLGLVPVQ